MSIKKTKSNTRSRTSKAGLSKKSFQFKWWMGVVIVLIVGVVGILVLRFSHAASSSRTDTTSASRKQANEIGFERLRLDRQYWADKGDKNAAAAVPQKLTADQLSAAAVKAKTNVDVKAIEASGAAATIDQTQSAINNAPATLKQAQAKETPAQAKDNATLVAPPPLKKPADYPTLPSALSDDTRTVALINNLIPTANAYGAYNGAAVNAAFYTQGWNKYTFGFPGNNIPWCNIYIMWLASSVGKSIYPYPFVYSGTTAAIMYANGRLFPPGYYIPVPGDLVWFNWDRSGDIYDHIAIVANVVPDYKGGYNIATMNGNWGGYNNDTSTVQYVGYYSWTDPRITTYADWFGY